MTNYTVPKENFSNGIDISKLFAEIKLSQISSKVESIASNSYAVVFVLSNTLTAEDVDVLNNIVTAHQPIALTAIELKANELINALDYHKVKGELSQLYTSLDILTDNEKEIMCKYCVASDADIITYYMQQNGGNYSDALSLHQVRRATDITNNAKSCNYRATTPVIKYIVIKYLGEINGNIFLDAARDFLSDYMLVANLGKNYRQQRDGIMDYIEATNSYVGGGLSTYTFESPYTYEQCRDELKNYLVYGNEPTEFNELSS